MKGLSDEELARRVQRYYQIQRRTYFISFGVVIWLLGPFVLWGGWDGGPGAPPPGSRNGGDWLLAAVAVAWVVGAVLHARAALRAVRRRGSRGV